MAHYEERLERDLQAIRSRVADLATRVDRAVENAIHALLRLDRDLAARVILGDHPINRLTRETDRLCHVFVARHLPAAGVLRYVSSVMRLMVELERVGDYAVAIARETVQLTEPVPGPVASDIEMLAHHCRGVLNQATQAFQEGNAELARGTKGLAAEWSATFDKIYADLLREGEQGTRPIKDIFAMLFAFIRLVRISDQAKNICEETIFAATGETKRPKVYKVLFLDAANSFRSVMAEAIARKSFPESGEYASAGWAPVSAVEPAVIAFLDQRGHSVNHLRPRALVTTHADLAEYQVIVGVEEGVREHLPEIPFHTVVLQWRVGPARDPAPAELTGEVLESVYHDLSSGIRDLMETLRGENAA